MNDALKALLESLGLSEDTVTQMTTIMEAAIEDAKAEGKKEAEEEAKSEKDDDKSDKDEEIKALEEAHAEHIAFLFEKANKYGEFLKERANAYGASIQESVTEKMKEYAEYSVEQFITENKARFVETEEYERMRSAFGSIMEAFEHNGFDVRDNVAVIELQESLNESTNQYEQIFEQLSVVREELEATKKTLFLKEATKNLSDLQMEKVESLLEAVSVDSLEEFESSVNMIVEQVANAPTVVNTGLEVQETLNESKQPKLVDNSISRFLNPTLL